MQEGDSTLTLNLINKRQNHSLYLKAPAGSFSPFSPKLFNAFSGSMVTLLSSSMFRSRPNTSIKNHKPHSACSDRIMTFFRQMYIAHLVRRTIKTVDALQVRIFQTRNRGCPVSSVGNHQHGTRSKQAASSALQVPPPASWMGLPLSHGQPPSK